jgi:hypothetical protein
VKNAKTWIIPLLLASGFVVGCSDTTTTYRIELKSDTNWRAVYGQVGTGKEQNLIIGTGDKTIPITDAPPVCIIANNLIPGGYIDVKSYKHVVKKSAIFRIESDEDILQDHQHAEGPVAEVQACTQQ